MGWVVRAKRAYRWRCASVPPGDVTGASYGAPMSTCPDVEVLDEKSEALVVAELADLGPDEIRTAAADYLRVRTVLLLTMSNLRDWDGPLAEPARLARYVRHLASADHGDCVRCGWPVFAPHPYTELDRGRVWHPRVMWRALVVLVRAVRYGTYRIAHTHCLPRQPWD